MLWLRSARRRPAIAVGIVLIAATATSAAVLGALLTRSVQESALASALAQQPAGSLDVVVSAQLEPGVPFAFSAGAAENAVRAAAEGHRSVFGSPVTRAATAAALSTSGLERPGPTRLVAPIGELCAGLQLRAGTCATGTGTAVVPTGAARVGDRFTVRPPGVRPVSLRVVGVYATTSPAARTLADDPFDRAPDAGALKAFVTPRTLLDAKAAVAVWSRAPVDIARLDLASVSAARERARAVQQAMLGTTTTLAFDSGLPAVLDDVTGQRQAATGLVVVVSAQAVVAALLSAIVLLQALGRARAPEWALGRLRGLGRRALLVSIFAEPVILLLLGVVLGVGIGTGVAALSVRHWLHAGTGVEPARAPVVLAVVACAVALFAAVVSATARSARAPLATLLRDGSDALRVSRAGVAVESLILTATVASVYQLAVGGTLSGSSAGLALLAPALVAVTIGLLAVRLVTRAVRRSTTRAVSRPAGLLVWRQLGRRPSSLQTNIVVAVAVAVAVFAGQLETLSVRNQHRLADARVGAASVLTVRVPAGKNVLDATRAADPSGHAAMAVEELASSDAGGTSRVIAVDTSRLGAVSAWRPGWAHVSAAQLAQRLNPKRLSPITLRGTQLRLVLGDVASASTGEGQSSPPAVRLDVVVADAASWHTLTFSPATAPAQTLTAPLPCTAGCRLVQLRLYNSVPGTLQAHLAIRAMSTDRQDASAFRSALADTRRWQPVTASVPPGGGITINAVPGPDALRLQIVDQVGGSAPAVAPGDVPDPLPAVLAKGTETTPVAGYADRVVEGTGFDNQRQTMQVVGTAAVLPRSLDDGALVDLSVARKLSDPAQSTAASEVWLAPGNHAAVLRALTAQGLTIVSTQRLADARSALATGGPARAAAIAVVPALLAAALTVVLLAAAQAVDADRRRRFWAVGRLAGLRRGQLWRLTALGIAGPVLLAVVVGVVAGLVTVLLAGHRLPIFARGTITPPLDTTPSVGSLLAVVAVAALVAVVVTVVLAGRESRAAARTVRTGGAP